MKEVTTQQASAAKIDAQNRHIAQLAGLDQDLESQVPARYDSFSIAVLAIMLVVLFAGVLWIIL